MNWLWEPFMVRLNLLFVRIEFPSSWGEQLLVFGVVAAFVAALIVSRRLQP